MENKYSIANHNYHTNGISTCIICQNVYDTINAVYWLKVCSVYNERHEYFKRNISKERYTYIYTISDTDQQSTFHLYAKNA